jgi:uncharacterized membrane protein (DUF2068 family)
MTDEKKNLAVLAAKTKPKRAPTLYFIVAFKFMKGIAALLLAIGVYSLSDNNLPNDFRRLLEFLHIDPEKKFFLDIADRLNDVTPANLHWLTGVTITYGLFMLVQGVGLACRVSWAVWLVIAESAFFVPIEILDLIHRHNPNSEHPHLLAHPKIAVLIVLAVNVAIVWYLFKNRERIIKHHQSY